MGLDMYLTKRVYIGGQFEHRGVKINNDDTLNVSFKSYRRNAGTNEVVFDIPVNVVDSITCNVITWRKANAIHNYFVREVQNGEDDCGTYDVSKTVLRDLYSKCCSIRYTVGCYADTLNHYKPEDSIPTELYDHCMAVLPPVGGCFFGETDIKIKENFDWYFSGIQQTIDGLADFALAEPTDEYHSYVDYFYHASW